MFRYIENEVINTHRGTMRQLSEITNLSSNLGKESIRETFIIEFLRLKCLFKNQIKQLYNEYIEIFSPHSKNRSAKIPGTLSYNKNRLGHAQQIVNAFSIY